MKSHILSYGIYAAILVLFAATKAAALPVINAEENGIFLGGGLSAPVFAKTHYDSDAESDVTKATDALIGFSGCVVNYAKGLTFRFDAYAGAGKAETLIDSERNWRFDLATQVGFGWSPVRSRRFVLSACGVLLLQNSFGSHEETIADDDWEHSSSTITLSLGGNIAALISLTKSVVLFLQATAAVPVWGNERDELKHGSFSMINTFDAERSGFVFLPAVGVLYRWE